MRASLFALLLSFGLSAHAAVIETVAGGGIPYGQMATDVTSGQIGGVARFGGQTYFTLLDKHVVMRVDAGGLLQPVAGTYGAVGYAGDGGHGFGALFNTPRQIAVDGLGNIYVADYGNNRIRKIDAFTGLISTYAGGGVLFADGVPATAAALQSPDGLALAPNGDLYISTRQVSTKVRKVNAATGDITSVGGFLAYPRGMALAGNSLYVGVRNAIVKIDLATDNPTMVAGNFVQGSSGDFGPALSASIDWPGYLAWDAATSILYFSEDPEYLTPSCSPCANKVRALNDGYVDLVASGSWVQPRGLAVESGGLYVGDNLGGRIRRYSLPDMAVTSVAGGTVEGNGANYCCDGQPGTAAQLAGVSRLAWDAANNRVLFADYNNLRLRAFSPATGLVSLVAGNGQLATGGFTGMGGEGDGGPAVNAKLAYVDGVAIDAAGNIYIASSQEARIRMVDSSGNISTLAGDGSHTGNGVDGIAAASARVPYPVDVAVNTSTATLYIAQRYDGAIRAVDLGTGIITRVVGDYTANTTAAAYVDGQPGPNVKLGTNTGGIAVDPRTGDLYIVEQGRHWVLRLDAASGNVYRFAGNSLGAGGDSIDGTAATSAWLNAPHDVEVDPATGDVFISSRNANKIKAVSGGLMYTIAGTGASAFGGDGGDPTAAYLWEPQGLAVVGSDLYIGDSNNKRLRRIGSSRLFTPSVTPTQLPTGTETPVLTPTPTRTSTSTPSETQTRTPSPSISPTRTASPTITPVCAGGTTWGNTANGVGGDNLSGYVHFHRETAPATGTVPGLWIYINSSAPGNVRVALYNHSGATPGTPGTSKLAESADTALATAAYRWVYVPFTAAASVTSGQVYWMAWQISGTNQAGAYDSLSTYYQFLYNQAYGAFPASGTLATSFTTNRRYSIYAPLCPLPTFTATPTVSNTANGTFTATPTRSGTATVTPSMTGTPYITPTPICAAEIRLGNPLQEANNWIAGSWMAAEKLIVPDSTSLAMARVFMTSPAGAYIKATLYSASTITANTPGSLLYASLSQTAVSGWNEIPFSTPVLSPGTYYLNIIASNGSAMLAYNGTGANYAAFSGVNFASPAATFPAGSINYDYSISAVFCAAGTPTITNTITDTPTPYPCLGDETIIGNPIQDSTGQSLGYAVAQKLTVSGSATLYSASVRLQMPAGNLIQAGIYADSTSTAGTPGNRIALSNIIPAATGVNTVRFNAVPLSAGVTYWLHFSSSNGTVQTFYTNVFSGAGGGFYSNNTASWPPAAVFNTTGGLAWHKYSFFAGVCMAGTPTVTKTPSATPTFDDRTATPTLSATPTSTLTASPTPSTTLTSTITVTSTVSRTRTVSPTFSVTRTSTPTRTSTATVTVTSTYTITNTFTPLETATLSPTPASGQAFNSWMTDGTVYSVASHGGVTYLGGIFNSVGKATGGLAGFDAGTQAPLDLPMVSGNTASVWAMAPDGQGGFYIGGDFTSVAGEPVTNCAHITSAGTVNKYFKPNPDQMVRSLLVDGDLLYLGGQFTSVGGQARRFLAAVNRFTATLQATPNLTGSGLSVNTLLMNGSTLYLGGSFSYSSPTVRNYLAAIDVPSGQFTAFNPQLSGGSVNTMELAGGTLFIGGAFTQIAVTTRTYIGAVDAATGALSPWYPVTGSGAYPMNMRMHANGLYVSGSFTTIGGQTRYGVAGLNTSTAAVLTYPNITLGYSGSSTVWGLTLTGNTLYGAGQWNTINGTAHPQLLKMDVSTNAVDMAAPQGFNNPAYAYTLVQDGSRILLGGAFSGFHAAPRANLAAVDEGSGLPTAWRCDAGTAGAHLVNALAVSPSAGRLYVGGTFPTLSGVARAALGAVSLADGSLDAGFTPTVSGGAVQALLSDAAGLWVGGMFTSINSIPRNYAVLLDSAGTLQPWNPGIGFSASYTVKGFAHWGSLMALGGTFASVSGQARTNFALVDDAAGWAYAPAPNPTSPVNALLLNGDDLYIGGNFNSIGGYTRYGVARFDMLGLTLTANDFQLSNFTTVYALARYGGAIYVGGTNISSAFGAGNPRYNLVAYDAATQGLLGYAPNVAGTIYALGSSPQALLVGGQFGTVNGLPRIDYAALVPAPTITPLGTATVTPTFSVSPTFTDSPTFTSTRTETPTATPTATPSATRTETLTSTPTATPTDSPTISPTFTESNTFTVSPTATETYTFSPTPSITATSTESPTPSATRTSTQSPTPSLTSTESPTPSATRTATPTATPTSTPTATPTDSPTRTETKTSTPSPSSTQSPSFTITRTSTPTPTSSATPSVTLTGTRTATPTLSATPSVTRTPSPTPTATPTATRSATSTVTPTATPTATRSVTLTSSPTRTATATITQTSTVSPQYTATVTPTITVTRTATPTGTPTATRTDSPTVTLSWTATETRTASPTPSATRTATETATASATRTATLTVTQSATATATRTATGTATQSATATATPTVTQTSTISPTFSVSPTFTASPTITQTFTPVPFLAAAPALPPVVLGPMPVKKGQSFCLYTQQAVASSSWIVYTAAGTKAATLSFGNEASQCCSTDALAPGTYYVSLKVTLADGSVVAKSIKVSIVP